MGLCERAYCRERCACACVVRTSLCGVTRKQRNVIQILLRITNNKTTVNDSVIRKTRKRFSSVTHTQTHEHFHLSFLHKRTEKHAQFHAHSKHACLPAQSAAKKSKQISQSPQTCPLCCAVVDACARAPVQPTCVFVRVNVQARELAGA